MRLKKLMLELRNVPHTQTGRKTGQVCDATAAGGTYRLQEVCQYKVGGCGKAAVQRAHGAYMGSARLDLPTPRCHRCH